jgi:preprotein translocase subunit YajC
MNSLSSLSEIFGSTLGQAQPSQPNLFASLLPLLLIVVVMYFLMIRPQQKKQKAHKALVDNLKNGDEVVTAGGMYGTVAGIDDKRSTVYLKISGDVKVKVERYSVARVLTDAEKS